MKQLKNRSLIVAVYILLSVPSITCSSSQQINSTPAEITQAINNSQWIFSANYAVPSYGNSRNLTGENSVRCNKDTLFVALPYFGKLNSPAGAFSGNPLDFKSTNINLSKEIKNNGGWSVTIKPNNPEVQSMDFTFFDNGTAQLNVLMTNRSGISFNGRVMAAALTK